MAILSFDQISSILKPDFDAGKLFWIARSLDSFENERAGKIWNTRYAYKEAFTSLDSKGYLCGTIGGHLYRLHRVMWLLHSGAWPSDQIDHINGDRTDNRVNNLRVVSAGDNRRNQRISSRNTSGVSGVRWHKQRSKWVARIQQDGREKHLGVFEEFEEAVVARKDAEALYGYHENHGRQPE